MILLVSGGLDSVAAWRLLDLPTAVHFNLGTIPVARERKALEWATERFKATCFTRVLPMGEYEAPNGYLPFRNAMLILAAAQMDSSVAIAQVAEWAPDKNMRFYHRLEKAVNMPGVLAGFAGGLKIYAPFADLSKGELMARYHDRFGIHDTTDLLRETWSCYRDETYHCGHCGACVQRRNAAARFAELTGITLDEQFESKPPLIDFPRSDALRWIRDNGWLGVRQIRAERAQNAAGRRALGL